MPRLQTPCACPLLTRPRRPSAGLSVHCTSLSTVKPRTRQAEEEARHEVSSRHAEQQEHATDHDERSGRARILTGSERLVLDSPV